MVLPTSDLTGVSLVSALKNLVERESFVKAALQSAIPEDRACVTAAVPDECKGYA